MSKCSVCSTRNSCRRYCTLFCPKYCADDSPTSTSSRRTLTIADRRRMSHNRARVDLSLCRSGRESLDDTVAEDLHPDRKQDERGEPEEHERSRLAEQSCGTRREAVAEVYRHRDDDGPGHGAEQCRDAPITRARTHRHRDGQGSWPDRHGEGERIERGMRRLMRLAAGERGDC